MKLLDVTNRYHFLSIIGIVLVSGVIGYYLIKNIINNEFNEKLYADREQFLFEWHTYDNIREVFYLNIGDRIKIDSIAADIVIPPSLRDTTMWDDYEKKELPFRQLRFSDKLNDTNYSITITKSLLPSVDLQRGVGEFILLLTIGLILVLTYINGRISKKLWRPFFETLAKLDDFQIGKPNKIQFHKTNIREFDDLNETVEKMLLQIQKDFINLKEFTENASHEIQTPLAIIKSKLDNLLQDPRMTQDQLEELSKIDESVKRLSKLKSALSLLTKLENNQFQDVEKIQLLSILKNKLADFDELLLLKGIHLHTEYLANPTIQMNTELANILLNNLVSNAVKHNKANGTVKVLLTEAWLIIENTGEPLQNEPKAYFQRFKKDSVSAESSGLGLALVKRICDMYGIDIQYMESNGVHQMKLIFNEQS